MSGDRDLVVAIAEFLQCWYDEPFPVEDFMRPAGELAGLVEQHLAGSADQPSPPMSDTPTTAEEVVREAIDTWRDCYDADDIHGPTMPETIAALVRSSPAVLADLNGGEWVQPKDAAGKVPVWFQKFRDAWPEKRKPSEIGRTRPLFVFVPKRATDD